MTQREVDRLYDQAFRDVYEGSDMNYELSNVLGRVMERVGYHVRDTDEPRKRGEHPYAYEVIFQPAGEGEVEDMIGAEIAASFAVDAEAGTVTISFEPIHIEAAQARLEEAKEAMERLPRSVTLKASLEMAAEMKAFAEESARQKEEQGEGMKKFRAFAEAHLDRELTPEDFRKNFDVLRYAPIPDVDKGVWEIRKMDDRWRFVWYDKNEATGVVSVRDVIEFGDV